MARIRCVKPEYWTSAQVMELSRDARLLFIGMWSFCDDAGIHPSSVKRLKAEIFPADDLSAADVRRMIDECIDVGLVDEYEIGGQQFWIVTGWHHQKIDRPTFQHPRPDGSIPEGSAKRRANRIGVPNSTSTRRVLDDHSTNARRSLDDHSPPEGKGREGNGVDKTESTKHASGHAHACELCAAMRRNSIEAQPGDPRVIAAADAGVTIATIEAACGEAHDSKPGKRVPAGYVLSIAERWTREAGQSGGDAGIRARASPPRPPTKGEVQEATIAGLTGRGRGHDDLGNNDVIDVTATRIA